jgi:sucrose-6-phosphate hydrolase SacC (GH32 family)/nicotinamidase-related amidase/type 1 glutamine amidotransferase
MPRSLALLCLVLAPCAAAADHEKETLRLRARERVPNPADLGGFEVREKELVWKPSQTAIIICDMWDRHWCEGATRRVAEMAPVMDRVIARARSRGVLIIHAPSSCMEHYEGTPERQLAREAPRAANLPQGIEGWLRRLDGEPNLPIDDSDGGCDCEPQCKMGNPWKRQIEAISVATGDAVSDSGPEIWNLLEARGISNVIVMGVHTNMCVLGRPFSLRQMVKNQKRVVLARDLTDSMYNSRRAPFVSHRRGTELVVEHIERHICPSIAARDILGEPAAPRAVFVIGEDEYDTKETLPAFARAELELRGVRCRFVHADPREPNDFPGVEAALADADLLVLSLRRRTPREAQLAAIRDYLASGRPLVAIRTSSHAFDREPPPGHASWPAFDDEVLGGDYQGHYGNKPPAGPRTLVRAAAKLLQHPVLRGLSADELEAGSHLYRSRGLARSATVLMEGRLDDRSATEPVAWTHTYRGARVFYTSLGSPDDFALPAFRRLLLNAVFWAMERQVPETATAGAAAAGEREDLLIADFEGGDYGGWQASGEAFGSRPVRGTLPGQQPVSGFLGRGLVNTFLGGDGATGTLTSPPFEVRRRYINFLIGGGAHPGKTCINLIVDGEVARTATGNATTGADDEHLSWRTWDVSELEARLARIEIADLHEGPWGHINADHIFQSDRPKQVAYSHPAISRAMASIEGARGRAESDPARPLYHFRPPALWINDPNGPVFHEGYYHLFFQQNPYGDRWERMHWGHARSSDLVHWEQLPTALWPSEELGEAHCFSGSAAIRDDGTPVILYTSIGPQRPPEQWAALGDRELITWTKHPANPVITLEHHGELVIDDWRDPFIFREGGRWLLAVGGHRRGGKGCVLLYSSEDLLAWKFLGMPFEGEEANWECPNLFRLGGRWVLIYSPHGIVRYYTGRLDLESCKFTPEVHGAMDWSPDYYAPNCLEDDSGRRVLWGWVRNFPAGRGWNGVLTLPRVLSLLPDGRIAQRPAPELAALRLEERSVAKLELSDESRPAAGIEGELLEIIVEVEPQGAKRTGLKLRRSEDGRRAVEIAFNGRELEVAGVKGPFELLSTEKVLRLHIFLDRSLLEVYAGDRACFTRVISAPGEDRGVGLFAEGGRAVFHGLQVWRLTPIW